MLRKEFSVFEINLHNSESVVIIFVEEDDNYQERLTNEVSEKYNYFVKVLLILENFIY